VCVLLFGVFVRCFLLGRVPQKYPEQPALGVWVNKQRMEFKPYLEDETREMTLIISEKLRHLKDVGFEWAKPKGDQLWSEKYEELQQYRYYEGHCTLTIVGTMVDEKVAHNVLVVSGNVPTKYTKNPTLGRWVSTQVSEAYALVHAEICWSSCSHLKIHTH
jgi:hypothetical protein